VISIAVVKRESVSALEALQQLSSTGQPPLRVGPSLSKNDFEILRRRMAIDHCKWDAQIGDVTALAPFPLFMTSATWGFLGELAERLTAETLALESELLGRPDLYEHIALPHRLQAVFARRPRTTPAVARVMRFDFHTTTEGWRVSEVNTDVPGGYTEATHFTALAAQHHTGCVPSGDPTRALMDAITRKTREGGAVALTCAPGHMEDQQVVCLLASHLRARGRVAVLVSPHQLDWRDGVAQIATASYSGPLEAIVRFYQAEWLAKLPQSACWKPLFVGGQTPVMNPGTAVLSESKRLPLVWDALRTPVPTWRALLPETRAPQDVPWYRDETWLLKEAYGNTGDTVTIRGELNRAAWLRRAALVRWNPRGWIAQRRFIPTPLAGHSGLHACIGVYTVDGAAAGAYARVTRRAVIDGHAVDVPLLLCNDKT
jgi:glutathionylspermidine synthase